MTDSFTFLRSRFSATTLLLIFLMAGLFVLGCSKKANPTAPPSHVDGIEFEIAPQIEDPQSEADLNKYFVKFRSNFRRRFPLKVFRALPDGNWAFLGIFSPHTPDFTDRVNETGVVLRYRFVSDLPGTKVGPSFPLAVLIYPDRAIHHEHLNELSNSTLRLSRLLLLEDSVLVTQGKSAQIEAKWLIVKGGAKISVKDPDHKWNEDSEYPVGKFEIHAERAKGQLTMEPEFPRELLREREIEENSNPGIGTQEIQIQIDDPQNFQVLPRLEHAPLDKSEREFWQKFIRPMRAHLGDASFELCGTQLVPVEPYSGVFAREVQPRKREYFYFPAHQGPIGYIETSDSGSNGIFRKLDLLSLGSFRCGANASEFQIPFLDNDQKNSSSEKLIRINPEDTTVPIEVRLFASLHGKLLDLNRILRKKGVFAGFTFQPPEETHSRRRPRHLVLGETSAEKFMLDLIARPDSVVRLLKSRFRKSLLFDWEDLAKINPNPDDPLDPAQISAGEVVITYRPDLTADSLWLMN